jgi:hypothetical protein
MYQIHKICQHFPFKGLSKYTHIEFFGMQIYNCMAALEFIYVMDKFCDEKHIFRKKLVVAQRASHLHQEQEGPVFESCQSIRFSRETYHYCCV